MKDDAGRFSPSTLRLGVTDPPELKTEKLQNCRIPETEALQKSQTPEPNRTRPSRAELGRRQLQQQTHKSMGRVRAMLASALLLAGFAAAQPRQVAVTIDDLPRGGDGGGRDLVSVRPMTEKLLGGLRGIPVIGFVNAGRAGELGDEGLQTILRIWIDHGATLGNHSYSHPDLNTTPLDRYTEDVVRGEAAVQKAIGKRPIYFRHPFLHAGPDAEKREGLARFLAERGYVVAPVTLDNSDWMFAAVYGEALRRGDAALAAKVKQAYVPYMESVIAFFEQRSKEVVGREFPQTLLIHASQLNADSIQDLVAMFRRRGYGFVSLADALRDPAYRMKEDYTGKGGFSWIHRWSRYLGMPPKGEPDEPEWIGAEYRKLGR